jgi:transcriptional regulator with XRE-family HTH domain
MDEEVGVSGGQFEDGRHPGAPVRTRSVRSPGEAIHVTERVETCVPCEVSADGRVVDMSEWDAGPEDDEAGAVIRTVARQLRLWRESAGLSRPDFGAAIGYGEELIASVERGRRIPRPEYLDRADEVLGANGKIAALKEDVAEVRYPKKVRNLKKLEADATELCAYNNSVIHGLLQTEEYIRASMATRRPPFADEELEQQVAARLARQSILEEVPLRVFSFVQCESTLRRPIGGKEVMRRQLERLLAVAEFRNVDLQILPLGCEDNSGLNGSFRLLRLKDGTTVGHVEGQHLSRVIADPKDAQLLNVRYGIIRAQALSPRESTALVEKVLGET